jgi:pyruvate, water dikinase
MPDAPLVLPFNDPRCRQVALAGGKGASLATMTAEGLPVPPGFVVTSAAFEAAVDTGALRELMRGKDVEAARSMVAAAGPPKELIERHHAELTGPVAVRSSACAEDSEAASYAGQQETYLNTDGLAEVLANVVRCWLSSSRWWTARSPGCCSRSTRSTAARTAWSWRRPAVWARPWCPAR